MSKKARLESGTHRRRREGERDEVIRAGDVFTPTEREATQNAGRLMWLDEEPRGYTIDDSTPGWYKVIGPGGEQVGKSHRSQEAAEQAITALMEG